MHQAREAGNCGVHWGKEAGERRWLQGYRGKRKSMGSSYGKLTRDTRLAQEEEEGAPVFFDLLGMEAAKSKQGN